MQMLMDTVENYRADEDGDNLFGFDRDPYEMWNNIPRMPRVVWTSALGEFPRDTCCVFFRDSMYDDRRPIDGAQCCIGRARQLPSLHGFSVCIGAIPQVAAALGLVVGCIRTCLLMRHPPIRGSVVFKAYIVGKWPSRNDTPTKSMHCNFGKSRSLF